MRSLCSVSLRVFVTFHILSNKKLISCNPITNSAMNDRIREFSSKSDVNITAASTLQKEGSGRNANFIPVRNPVRFKDVPDSALSSSSYSRGLHHEHPGYTPHDYEESPPYGYEFHVQDSGHHGFDHHIPDYYGHHGGHHHINYHHKHYDHAIAAKAFLWPIAGIALLGAAAALVSNPVLLQLGVVSGRRKRRDTEENLNPELDTDLSWLDKTGDELADQDSKVFRRLKEKLEKQTSDVTFKNTEQSKDFEGFKNRLSMMNMHYVNQQALLKKLRVQPTVQSPAYITADTSRHSTRSKHINEKTLINVPLILKEKN